MASRLPNQDNVDIFFWAQINRFSVLHFFLTEKTTHSDSSDSLPDVFDASHREYRTSNSGIDYSFIDDIQELTLETDVTNVSPKVQGTHH